jgi:hypothetical protein
MTESQAKEMFQWWKAAKLHDEAKADELEQKLSDGGWEIKRQPEFILRPKIKSTEGLSPKFP